jgi:hypothetical protein
MLQKRNAALMDQQAQTAPMQGQVASQAPMQAAATFDRPAVEWFMIPQWMAGRWHKRGDLTVSVTDVQSGHTGMANVWTDNEMTVHFGHQVDRAGNIWHANFIPSQHAGDSDGETVRFVTVAQQCEVTNPQEVVTRTHYVVTKTMISSNEVVERFQQESINDYVLSPKGELENKSSNKMFRMNGQAYRIGVLQSQFMKVQEFAPENIDRGIDMRKALADYLHVQHLDNLIPEQVSMAQ